MKGSLVFYKLKSKRKDSNMNITHDLHVHTNLSLCAEPSATLENHIANAKKLGLTKIGIANHFWDEAVQPVLNGWYEKQNVAHVFSLRDEVKKYNNKDGLEILFGCEAEYDPVNHGVGITEECAEQLDFLIVPNSHTHMTMPKELYQPYEKHKEFMINAYREIINSPVSKYITSMAHPFEAVCCPYDNQRVIDIITDDEYRRIFDETAEKGIAVEINVSSMMGMSREQIEKRSVIRHFRLAKECGCLFTFGSDTHNDKEQLPFRELSETVADILGLSINDIAMKAR